MSKEMEYMDIDGPEFLSTINSEIATIRTNAGNDTSITEIFDSFKEDKVKLGNLAEANPGSLLVILPWIVIRELDGLNDVTPGKKYGQDIPVRARQAMRFIESRLIEKSNSLRGQKMNEVFSETMSQGRGTQSYISDKNLCIKVMVHDIESISTKFVPKMEALLNRIGGKHSKIATKKWTVPPQLLPEPVINTDDYVMEIDEFYPSQSNTVDEEDYDMMIDDDIHQQEEPESLLSKLCQGTNESRWAKYEPTEHKSIPKPVAYLDNDPKLVAPRKPPQENLTYSNSNHVPIKDDTSWTSIYSPR
ncbi:hypothetical protein MFLAVUS_006833 [Mucor flavus]|uniref:PIN domain-containing protein n=1 Tax=Mucor flavus TaxID=439312 RepID=A0ABP9Z2M2_9FUNG